MDLKKALESKNNDKPLSPIIGDNFENELLDISKKNVKAPEYHAPKQEEKPSKKHEGKTEYNIFYNETPSQKNKKNDNIDLKNMNKKDSVPANDSKKKDRLNRALMKSKNKVKELEEEEKLKQKIKSEKITGMAKCLEERLLMAKKYRTDNGENNDGNNYDKSGNYGNYGNYRQYHGRNNIHSYQNQGQ